MDGKRKPPTRTPQPPPPLATSGSAATPKQRSRSSTQTASSAAGSSPSTSAIAAARSSGSSHPRQPRTGSNNNISSPRATEPSHKPTQEEPATDEEDGSNRFSTPPQDEWLRQSEVTLATMEKQVHDAAKKTLKHQKRCSTMRESIADKEERMDTLQTTYASLTRALDELELISNSDDLDSDALNEIFMSIPSDIRAASLVHAE